MNDSILNDVYLGDEIYDPNLITIDPQLYAQQAQGLRAKNELGALQGGSAMAQALRQANTPMPEVTGSGYSANGPNLLQGLAVMAAQRGGQNKLNALEAQAQALRGQTEEGMRAQFLAEQQQSKIANAQKQEAERIKAVRAMQQAHARLKSAHENKLISEDMNQANIDARAERDRSKLEGDLQRLASSRKLEEFVNPDSGKSELLEVNPNSGELYRDGELISDKSRYSRPSKEQAGRVAKLSTGAQKDYHTSKKTLLSMARIERNMKRLTEQDQGDLSNIAKDVLFKEYGPGQWKQYVNLQMRDFSPAAKTFMLSLDSMDAQQRHELYGAALTNYELSEAQKQMMGASGLALFDRGLRAQQITDDAVEKIKSMDSGSLNLMKDLYIPVFYEHKDDKTMDKYLNMDAATRARLEELNKMLGEPE